MGHWSLFYWYDLTNIKESYLSFHVRFDVITNPNLKLNRRCCWGMDK